jgi:nitroreductase
MNLQGSVSMDNGLTSEIDHILSTARSVRRKLDFETPVSKQDIEACIDVAVQAPTGLAGENWRFMVITDADLKVKIADIYREVLLQISQSRNVTLKPSQHALMARLHEIPCMIMVFSIGEPGIEAPGQLAFYGSILPAAWSLMLAMRARGIGTTWTSLLSSRSDEISELLGIPSGVTQTVMLPAAYTKGAILKKAKRQPAREVTYWNGWLQKD